MPRPGQGVPAMARAVAPAADDLVAAAELGGRVGYLAVETATGRVIDARDPDGDLPPASTTKAITALYALDRLGVGFRFGTELVATGPVAGGRIAGDLVLAGSGDPTLSTDQLAAMAAELRAAGVRGVDGRFLIHDGALPALRVIDPSQPDHVGYNPAVSGLNLNFNRVHFEWRRGADGWAVAMDARSERFVPEVRVARMRVVNRQLPVYTLEDRDGIDDWTVASGALGKGGSRWLPVRNPGAYAGDVFRTLARAQGIDLPEPVAVRQRPEGMRLVRVASEPLPDMVRDMLRFSTNITAEVVGLTASGAPGLEASAGKMSDWARTAFGRAGRFVDHSGLGAGSRAAPADMVAALVAERSGVLRGMMKAFPMRDAKGREVKGHPIKVAAKTGTLNFVSALTGHAATPGGREVTFAILAADAARRDAVPMADREDPPGGDAWARRARILQTRLIERWAAQVG
jgi:D-alanyl-D-alanine carboxypeptidase/D-alanyl-D-alanine-endopeptidase (penicillin-binding protein 4)